MPICFIRSAKADLVRFIREYGIELSAEGRAALDALPDNFDAWRADPFARGTPIAPQPPRPLYQPEKALEATTDYAPRPDHITMIERLGPSCAIGTDGALWIVYKARPGASLAWDGEAWRAVGYIHSDKRALLACIGAKGLKLSMQGRAAVERQDDRIYRWRKAGEARPEQQVEQVALSSTDKPASAPATAPPVAPAAAYVPTASTARSASGRGLLARPGGGACYQQARREVDQ